MHLKDLFAFVFAAVSGGNLVGQDQSAAPPVHFGVPDSRNSSYSARPHKPSNSYGSDSSADIYGANNPYDLYGSHSSTDPSGTSNLYDPYTADSWGTDAADANNPDAPQSSAAGNAGNPYSPYASSSPAGAQGGGNPYDPYASNPRMGGQDPVNPYDPASLMSSRDLYGASRQYDPYAPHSTDGSAASRRYNRYRYPYSANAPSGHQTAADGDASDDGPTDGLGAGSETLGVSQSPYPTRLSGDAVRPAGASFGQDPKKSRDREQGWGDTVYDSLTEGLSSLSSGSLSEDPYRSSAYPIVKPKSSGLSGDPAATLGLNPLYSQGALALPRGYGAPPPSPSGQALRLGDSFLSHAPASPSSATALGGGGTLGSPLASPLGPVSPSLGQTVPGAIQ